MNYHRHLPNIVNESCTPSASYLYRIDGKSALQLIARQLYYTHVIKTEVIGQNCISATVDSTAQITRAK